MNEIVQDVLDELARATAKFPAFNSGHEGYAVIDEECIELRNEVYWGSDPEKRRAEAVQLAAMALRFIRDVCDA